MTSLAFGLLIASHRWLHCLVYLARLFGLCYSHLRCLRFALAQAVSWLEPVPSAQLPISAQEQMTTNINKAHVVFGNKHWAGVNECSSLVTMSFFTFSCWGYRPSFPAKDSITTKAKGLNAEYTQPQHHPGRKQRAGLTTQKEVQTWRLCPKVHTKTCCCERMGGVGFCVSVHTGLGCGESCPCLCNGCSTESFAPVDSS